MGRASGAAVRASSGSTSAALARSWPRGSTGCAQRSRRSADRRRPRARPLEIRGVLPRRALAPRGVVNRQDPLEGLAGDVAREVFADHHVAHALELGAHAHVDPLDELALGDGGLLAQDDRRHRDRKSTRLNSSHLVISYAVFCLKKKKYSEFLQMTSI